MYNLGQYFVGPMNYKLSSFSEILKMSERDRNCGSLVNATYAKNYE